MGMTRATGGHEVPCAEHPAACLAQQGGVLTDLSTGAPQSPPDICDSL